MSDVDYRDCIELAGEICSAVECYDGDDLLSQVIPAIKPIIGQVQALETQFAAERQARQDAELLARFALETDCCLNPGELVIGSEIDGQIIPCTIGPNGLPELTPAIRDAIQAAEGAK